MSDGDMMLTAADRALRKGRITSSTAAAALGLSSWASPLQAWAEITGALEDEDDEPAEDEGDDEILAHHERGHFLEPALLEWARSRFERDRGVRPDLVRPATKVHPTAAWAADSVDGLLALASKPVAALEAKSVAGGLDAWGEPGTAQVPPYVEIQSRWHCWVQDVPVCYVPMIGPRLAFSLYVVRREAAVEEALVETLHDWWEVYVKGGTQPPATGADERVLKRLFPRHRAVELPDDPAIAVLVRQDVVLREQLATAKASRSAVRAELMDRLRDAEGCRGDGYSVSWRASKDKTVVNWEGLARALEPSDEMVEKFTRVKPGPRVLRTTWRGEP